MKDNFISVKSGDDKFTTGCCIEVQGCSVIKELAVTCSVTLYIGLIIVHMLNMRCQSFRLFLCLSISAVKEQYSLKYPENSTFKLSILNG